MRSTELALVMDHLTPSMMYRLMCTNSELLQMCRDNKTYWIRVVFHLAFRPFEVSFPDHPRDLHDMILLPLGYNDSMNIFIAGIRKDIQERSYFWTGMTGKVPNPHASLSELVRHNFDSPLLPVVRYLDDPFKMCKSLVQQDAWTQYDINRLKEFDQRNPSTNRVLAVEDGTYICEMRRVNRASMHFFRAVDNEDSLSYARKQSVLRILQRSVLSFLDDGPDLDFTELHDLPYAMRRRLLLAMMDLAIEVMENKQTIDEDTGITWLLEAPISCKEAISALSIFTEPIPEEAEAAVGLSTLSVGPSQLAATFI